MPAPELVGQSSFHLGGRQEERELFIPLERRVIECGASCVTIPSSRDSLFGTHAAWSPHIMLPGGIARTGCRTFTGLTGTGKARTCGEVDRNDPDSWDGKILTDCVGCGCDETALGEGGQFRGVGFFCRLGVGVMLWTNDQDVAGITGDPDLLPGFDPGGNTWGMVEFDVFKPRFVGGSGLPLPSHCLSGYFLGNSAHMELRGCGCCYAWNPRPPFRSCGLHARLHTCDSWVNKDCQLDVSPCEPNTPFGDDCTACMSDPHSFICRVSGQRNNRSYYAGRWCQRGHYIGQARFVGVLRGQHSHVDDEVVRQNFDRFWAQFDFEDSQFCYTHDWGRFVGGTGHKLRATHRIDPRVNGFFELEFDLQFGGWIPLRRHWTEFTSVRSGFQDWPDPVTQVCAQYMGANRNGRTVEGPFPHMSTVSFGGT